MKFVKALVVALLLAHGAHAEGRTPFRATATKKVSKRSRTIAANFGKGYAVKSIPSITFTTRLHTEGNVKVSLNVQREVTWQSTTAKQGRVFVDTNPIELYQGEVKIRGVRYPAAASVVGGKVVLSFPGRQRGSRGSRQRIFTVTAPSSAEGAAAVKVASSPASIFHNKTCGHKHSDSHGQHHAATIEPLNVGMKQARMYHVLTLSTVADPELYARYGENTNAHIAGIVNAAETLFERQLGIRFQIVKQHVYSDIGALAIPETDPERLLKAFATSAENAEVLGTHSGSFDQEVDIKHLFTGKDLDGPTVGIAYIGAVCYQPQFSYSLTQMTTGGGAPYYFAHEIGHNLGARHDMAGWGSMSLMSPNIFVGSTFSKVSLDQINEHLLYFGSCLELKSMPPSLSNSRLSIKAVKNRRNVKFSGDLIAASGSPIAGAAIKLVIGKREVTLRTNSAGRFVYMIARPLLAKRTVVYAVTAGGEARSGSLAPVAW